MRPSLLHRCKINLSAYPTIERIWRNIQAHPAVIAGAAEKQGDHPDYKMVEK